MIFTQFVDDALGCASYLVGDAETGTAVVVDPAFAIEQYLEEAERRGVRIARTIETHTHADHISGHGRLALEHGVPVSIHQAAEATYPHDSMQDGDEIAVGQVVLRCIHTPGHRPEHCCLAVSDRSRGVDPWIVLTGDSLFVGDAARPDLAVDAREGAEGLFHSLRRLVELGDGVEVYPGHVAGSLCGKAMSSKASTTIGFERRFNPALAYDDVAMFIAESAAISVPRPPNMERIVEMNRGPFVGAQPDPPEVPAPPEGAHVLEYADPPFVERPRFPAGDRRVEADQPQRPEVDDVGHRLATRAGQPEGLRGALRCHRARARPRAAAAARQADSALSATAVYARRFVSLVKLEHTVFALPYAYTGAILALGRMPSARQLFWITVAMVGARSLAMALNRVIDASIDAANPRTARREIPAGLLSRADVIAFAAGRKRGHLFIKGKNVAVVAEDAMVDALVEYAEAIMRDGADAVVARADTDRARREAEADRAALLDEKGADANATDATVELIHRNLRGGDRTQP